MNAILEAEATPDTPNNPDGLGVILKTNAAVESVRQAFNGLDRPDEKWVRGICPTCGDDLVSDVFYVGGRGYLCVWSCWSTKGDNPTCDYRRVL